MEKSKPFFLYSFHLRNFMLHQKTDLEFFSHPIILLTGANGSGKTQILDAFILILGGHPKRLKKGKITDAIGPYDETASAEMVLSNPKKEGQRTLIIPDDKLAKLTNYNKFSILVTIHPNTGLNYFIKSGKKTHRVLRKDIRILFQTLSLQAENKLAFTEEGTVNIFSDQSDRNKLDLLLETTGLKAYRENIASSMDSIAKAKRALEPLRRKLALEKQYYQSMSKAREMAKKKEDLIKKHSELVIEEAWGAVEEIEDAVHDIEGRMEKKQRSYDNIMGRIQRIEAEIEQEKSVWERGEKQKNKMYREIEDKQSDCKMLEGGNHSNQRVLSNLEQKRLELEEEQKELEDPERKAQYQKYEKELKKTQKNLQRLSLLREKLGEEFFSAQTIRERLILNGIVNFRRDLDKKKIKIAGPVFQLIDEATPDQWTAICQIMGTEIFSFIADDRQQFESAFDLLKEMWPHNPPHFSLILMDNKEKTKPDKSWAGLKAANGVHYLLTNIFQAKIMASNDNKSHVRWNAPYLYRSWPSVGGGWSTTILQKTKHDLKEIEEGLLIEENYQKLSERKKWLEQEMAELESGEQLRHVKHQIEDCRKNIEELQNVMAKNIEKKQKFEQELEKQEQVFQDIVADQKQKREIFADKEKQKEKWEEDQEFLEKTINRWRQNHEEQSLKLQEAMAKAQQTGQRPEQIRPIGIVTQEKNRLEGKMENLEISPVSEEDYQDQKKKVENLHKELEGSDEHLQNLKKDVDKRFSQWHTEVAKHIRNISKAMNHLLAGILQGIRLRVDNLRDPARAALHLEIKRHTDRWHDLSHLSGGEKVLTVEALILSLHLQADSPIHAIDECTQRLDIKFKAQVFEMVQNAIIEIGRQSYGPFAPQFILLAPDTLGVEFTADFHRYFKQIVLAPAQIKN